MWGMVMSRRTSSIESAFSLKIRTPSLPSTADRTWKPHFERQPRNGPYGLLVVHHQYRGTAADEVRLPVQRLIGLIPADHREQYLEGASAAGLGIDLHRPLVSAHYAEHRGQPQPSSRELGGEERIEDPCPDPFVHSVSGVRDLDIRIESLRKILVDECTREIGLVDEGHPGGQGYHPAPVADRFRRVHDEVHDYLPELGRVALDLVQFMGQIEPQDDVLGDGRLEQVRHLLDEQIDVEGFDNELAPAGIGQELVCQLRRPECGGLESLWSSSRAIPAAAP